MSVRFVEGCRRGCYFRVGVGCWMPAARKSAGACGEERLMTCILWTDWKSSEAVSNGQCSTDRLTCGVERMLRMLALPRVHLVEALMQE